MSQDGLDQSKQSRKSLEAIATWSKRGKAQRLAWHNKAQLKAKLRHGVTGLKKYGKAFDGVLGPVGDCE